MSPAEDQTVAAVERALRILEAFRPADGELGLAELAKRTGVSKSTVLRLAATLERFGYIAREPNGAFRVGHAPLRLAAHYQARTQPSERILPTLRRLVDQTNESASYTIRSGESAICIYRVDSPQIVRDHVRPGDAHHVERGASGRAIVAFTPPLPAAYASDRAAGYVLSLGELTPDFASIAAPVFDDTTVPAGAVAISGPRSRFDPAAMGQFTRALLAGADDISLRLGGLPRATRSRDGME